MRKNLFFFQKLRSNILFSKLLKHFFLEIKLEQWGMDNSSSQDFWANFGKKIAKDG